METLLEVKNLKKYFKTPGGMLHAVDDISFSMPGQYTMGIVGESGCGKSTLGRTVIGLLHPTEGEVWFQGRKVSNLPPRSQKALCAEMQIVFQDPFSSLDPRLCVAELIDEPLAIFRTGISRAEREKRVRELMDMVGLAERLIYSYPHELDGGRRQRIGIARALALRPRFIVCDEPVSALDVSIQAQIINLLQDLKKEQGISYLFITHDMSVVKHISDEIIVMYLGQMVERCKAKELFRDPLHPYTKGLLSAIPIPRVENRPTRIIMKGELTSPIDPAPGCRFASRCEYATEACRTAQPKAAEVAPGHFVACHLFSESAKE